MGTSGHAKVWAGTSGTEGTASTKDPSTHSQALTLAPPNRANHLWAKGPQVDYKESTHTFTGYLQIKEIMCLGHLHETIVKGRETCCGS